MKLGNISTEKIQLLIVENENIQKSTHTIEKRQQFNKASKLLDALYKEISVRGTKWQQNKTK